MSQKLAGLLRRKLARRGKQYCLYSNGNIPSLQAILRACPAPKSAFCLQAKKTILNGFPRFCSQWADLDAVQSVDHEFSGTSHFKYRNRQWFTCVLMQGYWNLMVETLTDEENVKLSSLCYPSVSSPNSAGAETYCFTGRLLLKCRLYKPFYSQWTDLGVPQTIINQSFWSLLL